MAYPGMPAIRIGYMARVPYPVNVNLPPLSQPDTRLQIRTVGPELDIAVPDCPERHEKLGQFMDAWSSLESILTMLLSELALVKLDSSYLIFPKLGTKNAIDLLDAFGRRKLDEQSADTLTSLLDRVRKLNTKRNILVHGHWVLEANVLVRRGQAILVTQFLREIIPLDPKEAEAMANPRNQKERVKYTFTLKRIDATTRDTNTINREISKFMQVMTRKPIPPSEIPELLSRSRPYRVTYS
jgi:hypothetical protein